MQRLCSPRGLCSQARGASGHRRQHSWASALQQILYLNNMAGNLAKGHWPCQMGCPNPSTSLSHSPKGTWVTHSPVTGSREAALLTIQLTALKPQHSRRSSELHPAAIPVLALEVFPCLWLAQPLNGVLGFFPKMRTLTESYSLSEQRNPAVIPNTWGHCTENPIHCCQATRGSHTAAVLPVYLFI